MWFIKHSHLSARPTFHQNKLGEDMIIWVFKCFVRLALVLILALGIISCENSPSDPTPTPTPVRVINLMPTPDSPCPPEMAFITTVNVCLDKYEITNAQYQKCVKENICEPPDPKSSKTRTDYYENAKFEEYPVVNVSWVDADKYCREFAQNQKRLPTRAELQDARSELSSQNDTRPVQESRSDVSSEGVYNLLGNVREWTDDGPTEEERYIQDGSFDSEYAQPKSTRRPDVGFRCAMKPSVEVTTPTPAELKILQWEHFVPRYDEEWFDEFADKWGTNNGVNVIVDHIPITDLVSSAEAEIDAGEGHDLIELHFSPADFEPFVNVEALNEVNQQAVNIYGTQSLICQKSTFNPTTQNFYGFCHAWTPDPGIYRKSFWQEAGFSNGPTTYQDLLNGGEEILAAGSGPQVGIGISPELDSNMAVRAVLWSFGASVQDESENVVINSPETVAAVEYMAQLYEQTMRDGVQNVFNWTTSSNNKCLIAGSCSYILNSISAYRTAQNNSSEFVDDIFFAEPLRQSDEITPVVAAHVYHIYIIPKFAQNPEDAKKFLLHLVENYQYATYNSELYNFPAWAKRVPKLNEWLDNDPFNSVPANKLAVLRNAENWTTNIGHPGPANAAVSEVLNENILIDMVAKVIRDEIPPQQAVDEAELEINKIFEKWRAEGLVGGGSE